MQMDLTGRSAVVSGAGTGIGRSTAVEMAKAGAAVTLVGRRVGILEETAAMIKEVGGQSLVVSADIGNPADVEQIFAQHKARFGGLEILVNNAAIIGPTATVGEMAVEDWMEAIQINLTGPFLCSRAALPMLRASGKGRIITIGSLSAHFPRYGRSPYCTAKAGLLGLTRVMALEEGPNQVLVNYVCPGTIMTERIEGVMAKRAAAMGTTPEQEIQKRISQTPIGRVLRPDEIASMCLFLASDLASGITGETINIGGGRFA